MTKSKTVKWIGLAFLGTIACLAFAVPTLGGAGAPEDYPEYGLTSIFRDDFPFIIPKGLPSQVSLPPPRRGCGVKLLCTGYDAHEARLRALKDSRRSVRVQTYIFTGDEAGKDMARRLRRKRRLGLDVRLIVDAYTKFKAADRRVYADLELNGVEVMGFEPIYLLGKAVGKPLSVEDVNMRFHEKYWVVDDVVAFMGGTNVANEYFRYGDAPEDQWRDQDVMLTGQVVADVARAFDENYEYFKERRERRLPTNRFADWARLWWKISKDSPIPLDDLVRPLEIDPSSEEMDDDSAAVRFIRHRPRMGEDYIYQAYLHLLGAAEESIIIENAYFVPNRALINTLIEARERDVRVVVITNSEATNDVSGMQPLSRYVYLPLIEAGVEVYEWRGLPGNVGSGSLHAKCAVIDGRVSVVGSFNLDPRSVKLNSESVALIDSEKVASSLASYIENSDLPDSDRIGLEKAREWRNPKKAGDQLKLMFGMTLEDWY